MIIYTFIIISFISSIPYAFSQITVNGPKDVLVGGNAKLVWVVKLDVKSFEQYLYNDTEKDGEDLWNSIDQNNINGLIGIFGKGRVKFEKIVEPGSLQLTFTLEIKDIKFNESFSFLLFVKDKTGKEMQKEGIINVYGFKKVSDLPPSIDANEGKVTPFNIGFSAEPAPTIEWLFDGKPANGQSSKEVINMEMKEYNYNFNLGGLKAKDCGKELSYVATGYQSKTFTNKTKVTVIFKPAEVEIEYFNQINDSCQQVKWKAIESGDCANDVTYNLEILNDTNQIAYKKESLQTFWEIICNLTNITSAKLNAVYKGTPGPPSSLVLTTTPPPPPTVTPETTAKKITKENISSEDDGNIGIIIGGAVGGVVVLIIIIILVVCILKKKSKDSVDSTNVNVRNHAGGRENEGISNSGEEIHLHQWQQNQKENLYSTAEQARAQPREDPNQAIYSELGPGGRAGPKPAAAPSNYAEVKLDEKGYPIAGDPITPVERTPYDQVRKNSDDDFDHGIIV